MFAVIEDGSRQYRVQEGDTLVVDYREFSRKGDSLTFAQVLLANAGGASAIGRPTIDGATVEAEVVDSPVSGPKIEVQKIRRRKNSRTHTGHRQKYTSVVIRSIEVPGLEWAEPSPRSAAEAAGTKDNATEEVATAEAPTPKSPPADTDQTADADNSDDASTTAGDAASPHAPAESQESTGADEEVES